MEELYKYFVQYRESLKIFHFQCKKFSEHKASDETLSEFDDLFDKFVETYKGQYSFNIKNINININGSDIFNDSKFLIKILNNIPLSNDLANIRDEIVGLLHKFLYLLTLS